MTFEQFQQTRNLPICTCIWSPVNTTAIDPPFIEHRDPLCPKHGWCLEGVEDPIEDDDDYERAAEDAQRRRDAGEGFDND